MAERNLHVAAVFLVGFMGSGKTSVGRALSHRLGWRFEDLDDRVQSREGRTIAQIFQESGEAEFRRAELAALRELLVKVEACEPVVIALGGGAVIQAEIASLVLASGYPVVFLDASVSELWRRCQNEKADRPLSRDQRQFRHLHQARLPHYAKAGVRIDTTDKAVDNVAAEIVAKLGLRRRDSV